MAITLDGTTGITTPDLTDTSLTATRVVYAGASGNLTGSAGLTFDGTTLSTTGFTATDGLVANTTNWFNAKIATGTVTQGYVLVGSATPYTTGGNANTRFQVHGSTSYNPRISITSWSTAVANPANLVLGKSKGAAIGTQGAVASGDSIGGIYFEASDGTSLVTTSSMEAVVDATPSTGSVSSAVVFKAGINAEQMRLTSTGLKTRTTISVGDATPSTSGAGITFPATQSASSDANTLDDYEEGTFTPTAGGGTTITGTSVFTGTYTKVGKIVSVSGYVGGTTVSYNPAGGNFINGLPFAVISNTIGGAMMQNGNNSGSSVASVQAGSAILGFASIASGAGTIFYFGTFMTS
jgi:hypothetical protein